MIEYVRNLPDEVIIQQSTRMSERYMLDDDSQVTLVNKTYSWIWEIPYDYGGVEIVKNIQDIEWNIIYHPEQVEFLIKSEGAEKRVIPYTQFQRGIDPQQKCKLFQIRRDWDIQVVRYNDKDVVGVSGRFAAMDISKPFWKLIDW